MRQELESAVSRLHLLGRSARIRELGGCNHSRHFWVGRIPHLLVLSNSLMRTQDQRARQRTRSHAVSLSQQYEAEGCCTARKAVQEWTR
jgi:hypothetical protein